MKLREASSGSWRDCAALGIASFATPKSPARISAARSRRSVRWKSDHHARGAPQAAQEDIPAAVYAKNGYAGFSLIELIVVLTIFLLLIVGSFSLFRSTQVSAHLNEQSSTLIHALRSAQIQSLYGQGNNSHGIYFTTAPGGEEQIIRYAGASYAGRVAGSEILYTFPVSIDLTLQLSTTTPEILFSRNTGMPSATGTIILDLAGIGSRTITVNRLGAVDEL